MFPVPIPPPEGITLIQVLGAAGAIAAPLILVTAAAWVLRRVRG